MIRKADRKDIEQILFVINQTNKLVYRGKIPKKHFKDPFISRTELEQLFENRCFFVCEKESKIVGVASLASTNDLKSSVRFVYVLSEHQRTGVGTSLMKFAEEEANSQGATKLTLLAGAEAPWAIEFYQKLRYKLVGECAKRWGKDIIFEKELHDEGKPTATPKQSWMTRSPCR